MGAIATRNGNARYRFGTSILVVAIQPKQDYKNIMPLLESPLVGLTPH